MKQILINETTLNDGVHLDAPIVACIGYFDGLHRGHQALIKQTQSLATQKGAKSALITFDPDPWSVIKQNPNVHHITPLETKARLLEQLNLDYLIIIAFTPELSKSSPQEFIDHTLGFLNLQGLICGRDYRFGFKGAGNSDYLVKHYSEQFEVVVMDLLFEDTHKIGTTHITQKILKGEMESVHADLGRDYSVSGEVIHGRKQGRKIGFPTANLAVSGEFVLPAPGVYAGYVIVDGVKYQSLVNLGYNPTFNTTETLSVETHILDFNEEIYGKTLIQSFSHRIRDELKFDSIDALIAQMEQDVVFASENLKKDMSTMHF